MDGDKSRARNQGGVAAMTSHQSHVFQEMEVISPFQQRGSFISRLTRKGEDSGEGKGVVRGVGAWNQGGVAAMTSHQSHVFQEMAVISPFQQRGSFISRLTMKDEDLEG